jgi:flavin-binding protein dodecin
MYRMIEVVGLSAESYAEATKSAIAKIQATETVYWFEVVELRGGVRDGAIEFQVKLKVAIK